ncbi:MAG: ABC transporter permease [Planctomycetaceae bacterium]|jgi:ribose transport system permease protein|nr:ABC transporter permease [Planctomycetaceae bacterium]MCE2814658.1 ABC transporter permease [Planctomycetaceae bacterium]
MRLLNEVFTKYSMVLVLLGLCLFFSVMTVREQQPTPQEAVRQVWGELPAPSQWGTVVVASPSPEDQAFAIEFESAWKNAGVSSPEERVWVGNPQEIRKKILAQKDQPIEIVLAPGARDWVLFEDIETKFPDQKVSVKKIGGSLWPNFLKRQNLINVVNRIVEIGILAVGMTLVILTGGIDLSVGSLIALASVVTTVLIRDYFGGIDANGQSVILAGLAGIAVCGVCGLFNGCMIVGFKIPPFIATLAMMMIASGIAFMISKGQSIDQVPSFFVWLGRGHWVGIPTAVWLMLLIFAVAHSVMTLTTYGRSIYAIGGNEVAARLCGVRVDWIMVATYGFSGLLAGLGGLVMASRLGTGDAKYGLMYELYVIAAVVVGGTSLRGGYGSMFGTLVGALIIAVIENGMNLMQIDSYAQKVVFGSIILLAVLIDRFRQKA